MAECKIAAPPSPLKQVEPDRLLSSREAIGCADGKKRRSLDVLAQNATTIVIEPPRFLLLQEFLLWWWHMRNPVGGPYNEEAAVTLLRRCGADGEFDGGATGIPAHDPLYEPRPIRRSWWRALQFDVVRNAAMLPHGLRLCDLEFDTHLIAQRRFAEMTAEMAEAAAPDADPITEPAATDPVRGELAKASRDEIREALGEACPGRVWGFNKALRLTNNVLKPANKYAPKDQFEKVHSEPRFVKRRVCRHGEPIPSCAKCQ